MDMVTITVSTMPRLAGRMPVSAPSSRRLFRNFCRQNPASTASVRVGVTTPRLATIAPSTPATRMPAKVAQLVPRGPGVISAMATMSATSVVVIQ